MIRWHWGDSLIPRRKRLDLDVQSALSQVGMNLCYVCLPGHKCSSTWRLRWGYHCSWCLKNILLSSGQEDLCKNINIIKCGKRNVYTNLWFLIKARIAGFLNKNFWLHMWDLQLPSAPIKYDLWGAKQCVGVSKACSFGTKILLCWVLPMCGDVGLSTLHFGCIK